MALTEQRKDYLYEYKKNKLKRVPLDVPIEKYEDIKAAADSAGESVNGYIKKAIEERMERENTGTAAPEPLTRQANDMMEPVQNGASYQTASAPETSKRQAEPQNEPQNGPHGRTLPEYLTPDILAHIDQEKFAHSMAYQLEI